MNKYLRKLARNILGDEIKFLDETITDLSYINKKLEDESKEHTEKIKRLERKIKRYDQPENIILSYYRVDNVGINGMPPSYLKPDNPAEYTQRIHELESIYRNSSFRELIAWSLNFHANMSISGKIKNEFGDEIDVPTEHARYMIQGIRSIWELVVAAHIKDTELTASKTQDISDILDTSFEEGN